jgi:hypothetical protein
MPRDVISPGQIGMTLRRVLLRQVFAKALAQLTGAEKAFVMAVAPLPQMNHHEDHTRLEVDGTLYRVIVTKLDR